MIGTAKSGTSELYENAASMRVSFVRAGERQRRGRQPLPNNWDELGAARVSREHLSRQRSACPLRRSARSSDQTMPIRDSLAETLRNQASEIHKIVR
jgi:hypothetical protein